MLSYFQSFVTGNDSPKKLALSFCVGNYIAFSPFFGLHTILVFLLSWLLKLNIAVVFAVSCSINNPWTAIPIYSMDYFCGYWIMHTLCLKIHYTPYWYILLNRFIQNKIGFSLPCIWPFLIGGNVVSVLLSILLYPIILAVCYRWPINRPIGSLNSHEISYQE